MTIKNFKNLYGGTTRVEEDYRPEELDLEPKKKKRASSGRKNKGSPRGGTQKKKTPSLNRGF